MKSCECGCGQPAPIAKWTDKRTGAVAGHPQRFVKGHQNRGHTLPRKPMEERFWPRVDVREPSECWRWMGYVRPSGYGEVAQPYNGNTPRYFLVHRVAYELVVGELPDEDGLDHTCHDPATCDGGSGCPHRACCNPSHLRPASSRENSLRGGGVPAINAAKTHCIHGHEFTPANTYEYRGNRFCRQCHADANRRYRSRG